ncbi:MAG: hypothetical protein V1743_02890 [Nanoarchaeota archaeon]
MGKIAKDSPLAELTLRKYERPENLKDRELIRKFCLSLGLLQPGDSRDVIVDVMQAMLESRKELSSKDVEELVIANRKKYKLELLGIASSNIRRQLLRLRDLFFVEKVGNNYRINAKERLAEIFNEHIENYYLSSIISRIKEYLKEIDSQYAAKISKE